ncbi:hypothetical protein EVAR_53202_1 [Eumeta japonica]|uniref:Uncharacterized protein n=1 Tax=Eumeta variegata TaxID=151549 RepID=A0A4C1XDV7_EUMVA|nr:hypothetical protein EVAR_53202_1 [Eumeta japonica]
MKFLHTENNKEEGCVPGTKHRRALEASPAKTENSLPSSRIPSKSSISSATSRNETIITAPPSTTPVLSKLNDKRKNTETGAKPSNIPLSKKITEKEIKTRYSPIKQNTSKTQNSNRKSPDNKIKQTTSTGKATCQSVVGIENNRVDRSHRAQKDSESFSEKYHNSKKRLISVENISPKRVSENLPDRLNHNSKAQTDIENLSADKLQCDKGEEMFTLHETVRSTPSSSRLSQEMDSLAALTKQTLDRVSKLSNNLASNKFNLDTSEPTFDALFGSTSESKPYVTRDDLNNTSNNKAYVNRGVNERLRDIDSAAQRLIDFEKQSAMFSDLNSDGSSHSRRQDAASTSFGHTPVSILKRKSIHDDSSQLNTTSHAIASPPVTFSPSVVEPHNSRSGNRQRQGILKKRRSLDESQVSRRRSCSPEVSFADDGSSDASKPILKNRRSSLEDVMRNRSPDGQIQGILKRKHSREDDHVHDDFSYGSPEPHSILKRKSNSSSSSSTTSSHVSIAQAVLLAAAGGAEIVDEDKEIVRPILKKKSFSEERSCPDILPSETPKPILKKKSLEQDDHDFDRPKKPILKTFKKLSSEDGNASSFDLSEDDRSSRRPSLLKSRTSDHSGSECETTVKPILKQRGSSLTRERSQSPRPRLSFCATNDNDTNIDTSSFSCDASGPPAGPSRLPNFTLDADGGSSVYPSAVIRRRNLRPNLNPRSKSLACDFNDELLSILNNRRLKVDEHCGSGEEGPWNLQVSEDARDGTPKTFPSIASRIKSMERALMNESVAKDASRCKTRDRDRYKTQPITLDEMRSATSSLEPGQANFQAIGPADGVGSFPSRPVEFGASSTSKNQVFGEPEKDPFAALDDILDSPPFSDSSDKATNATSLAESVPSKDESYGEATFLDFENGGVVSERRQSTLEEIEKEVDKVRVALDEDCRALDEDERQQAEADNWSLNVSCDSGVYNRASSRDSGPHSGEELCLIESQEIKENHANNSITNDWAEESVEPDHHVMDRRRKSAEVDMTSPEDQGSDDDCRSANAEAFGLGLVKSNSVVARASMWQQLQQQARGTPRPLIRHSRSKNKEGPSVIDRFKTQPISWQDSGQPVEKEPPITLSQSKSSANVLDRDEDAKLDEDDPAKLSLMEKMKMFNAKLTHKPPIAMAVTHKPKEERATRASRLRTMPVLASQVQEALDQNERLTKSMTHEEIPRNPDFQRKMELFRSASAKNTSLEYIMRQDARFRSLDLDDDSPSERAQRMITPEVRGILKSGTTTVLKSKTLAKGESSEGLKDEGIDSSSDDESASDSSVLSSEKSCLSSDSCDETPEHPRPKRFQPKAYKNNKLKSSRTDSDLARTLQDPYPRKILLPGANELKDRMVQTKKEPQENRSLILGKLHRKPDEPNHEEEDKTPRYRRFVKKLDEPIQLGKLRRPTEKPPQHQICEKPAPILKISAMNKEAKNRFFGLETAAMQKKEKSIDELAAAVRKYIPAPVSKSISTHAMELASGSDGESSGGREVRHINARVRHRFTDSNRRHIRATDELLTTGPSPRARRTRTIQNRLVQDQKRLSVITYRFDARSAPYVT